MTHSCVCHDSFMCAWESYGSLFSLIRTCAMTHSCVCHGSFVCVPWLSVMAHMYMYVWHDSTYILNSERERGEGRKSERSKRLPFFSLNLAGVCVHLYWNTQIYDMTAVTVWGGRACSRGRQEQKEIETVRVCVQSHDYLCDTTPSTVWVDHV